MRARVAVLAVLAALSGATVAPPRVVVAAVVDARPSDPARRPSGAGVAAVVSSTSRYGRIVPALVDLYTRVPGAVGAGTGIVLSTDGEVLTNNHVVAGASRIVGHDLGDGRDYPVRVVGVDRRRDVAVVRLVGASGLAVAPLGDSGGVRVGDQVAAVGNAGGRGGDPSISVGQVTALGQTVDSVDSYTGETERLHAMIQVDAAVLPGDSGGPLLSALGQVIGMDTAAREGPPTSPADPTGDDPTGDGPTADDPTGASDPASADSTSGDTGDDSGQDSGPAAERETADAGPVGFAIPINRALPIAARLERAAGSGRARRAGPSTAAGELASGERVSEPP